MYTCDMTDQSDHQVNLNDSTQVPPTREEQPSKVQLEYPHILLQTSLESLLTHSYPSAFPCDSVKMATQSERQQPLLDESWASLDNESFNDEEAHSEIADNVSLLDGPSTEDEESVIEYDNQSDVDRVEDVIIPTPSEVKISKVFGSNQDAMTTEDDAFPLNDTIVLLPTSHNQNSSKIDLSLRQNDLSAYNNTSSPRQDGVCCETIKMSISHSSLEPSPRPFHVAYYGTPSAQVTRPEVLSKVGSALVAARSPESSTTYHIAPSEFDADLKPRSAELVPSDAQMFVEEITIVKPQEVTGQSGNIEIAFKNGTIIRSRSSASLRLPSQTIWRPDLLVVHLSHEDCRNDTRELQQLCTLADRHNIPMLMVANELICEQIPMPDLDSLHRKLEWENAKGGSQNFMSAPIDLESFTRLDSEQLNRHIRLLIDRSQEDSTPAASGFMHTDGLLSKLGLTSSMSMKDINLGWTQEELDVKVDKNQQRQSKEKSNSPHSEFWSKSMNLVRSWSMSSPAVKSLVISIALMVVIAMLTSPPAIKTIEPTPPKVSCSNTKVMQTAKAPFIIDAAPVTSVSTISTTSTSVAKSLPSRATAIPSQSDLLAYILGPNSVQRYVGDVLSWKDAKSGVAVETVSHSPTPEVVQVTPVLSKVHNAIEKVRSDVQVKLEQAQEKFTVHTLPAPGEVWSKHVEKLIKMQEDAKMTLDLVADNVQMLSKRSRRRFFKMVEKNQALLVRSREATEGQIGEILKEQKKVLAVAQSQARKLMARVNKGKKGVSYGGH